MTLIEQALSNISKKYNVVTKIYEPGEYVEIGCKKQAERSREIARKQLDSKCGLSVKHSLEAHADAIEKFYQGGNRFD